MLQIRNCFVLLFFVAAAGAIEVPVIWEAPVEWRQIRADDLETGVSFPVQIAPEPKNLRVETKIPPLEAGPVYRLLLEAKAEANSPVVIEVSLGKLTRKRTSSVLSCGPALSSEWETFSVPFTISEKEAGKPLALNLRYGWGDASALIRNLRVEKLGADQPLTAYERTGRWYDGQDRNAAWRKKASERIEKNRKGNLIIRVTNSRGNPIEGARVIAEQTSHSYRFGTAVNSQLWRWVRPGAHLDRTLQAAFEAYRRGSGRLDLTFAERQAEIQKYFDVLESDFNFAVFENALKWEAWSGAWGGFSKEHTFEMIDWMRAREIGIKAHTVVWPGWSHMPAFIRSLADQPEALRRVIDAHITELGLALNGKVETVDVLNEAFNNKDLMKLLGDDETDVWYKRTKDVFPDAQLNVNDFLLMANGGRWIEKLDFYDDLVSGLLDAEAPLEGIGFQTHFRHTHLTPPERIWELCDRFGRFGLPLISSEFDVNLPDEKLQADYTRDFMIAWFSHPGTQAFIHWGFWQDSHWLPYAGLYDRDWRMKPNAKIYRGLVFEQWWSGWEEALTTGEGSVALRGFLGTYRVSICADGKERVLENVLLNKEGTCLTVSL